MQSSTNNLAKLFILFLVIFPLTLINPINITTKANSENFCFAECSIDNPLENVDFEQCDDFCIERYLYGKTDADTLSTQNILMDSYPRCGLANGDNFTCSQEYQVSDIFTNNDQVIKIDGINFLITKTSSQTISFQGINYTQKPSIKMTYSPSQNRNNLDLVDKKISLFIRNISTTTIRLDNAISSTEGDESNGSGGFFSTSEEATTHISFLSDSDKIIFGYNLE